MEKLYRKVGRRYKEVPHSDWSGFPSDGIWIVQSKPDVKSAECVMKIGELEEMQPAINLILGYKEKLLRFFSKEYEKSPHEGETLNNFVLRMLKEITKKD